MAPSEPATGSRKRKRRWGDRARAPATTRSAAGARARSAQSWWFRSVVEQLADGEDLDARVILAAQLGVAVAGLRRHSLHLDAALERRSDEVERVLPLGA